MGRSGRYQHGIAYADAKLLIAQHHHPFTRCDVVELFTIAVEMEQGGGPRWHHRLGEALVTVAVLLRMHQLTDS